MCVACFSVSGIVINIRRNWTQKETERTRRKGSIHVYYILHRGREFFDTNAKGKEQIEKE